jgi:hypothetical protein
MRIKALIDLLLKHHIIFPTKGNWGLGPVVSSSLGTYGNDRKISDSAGKEIAL